MRKYSIAIVLFATILLFSAGYAARNIYQRKVIDNNRHVLFCETLRPGMSISEVSEILNGKGNVIIGAADGNATTDESVNFAQYSILFTDKEEQELYGGWLELIFVQRKYNQAYELGFDYAKEYCNFGLTPQ